MVFHVAHLGIDTQVRKYNLCATMYIKEISMKSLEFKGQGLMPGLVELKLLVTEGCLDKYHSSHMCLLLVICVKLKARGPHLARHAIHLNLFLMER